ncbi:MAG TPA: hypothetical protein VEB42_10435, partial [Chitinophagaceae bacterium]|nr:hypothetical protein [Chitinophagaceae bacterium]
MRRALPLTLLSVFALITTTRAQTDHFAYAITDLTRDGQSWNALRKLDLRTGQYSDVLLNGSAMGMPVFDAATKKQFIQQNDQRFGNLFHSPFTTGVAAAAYDRKNNRLYFTPMFVDQLRYVDLKTMKVYYVTDQSFTKLGNMHNDEGKIITRMVITPDGDGYAISNDAKTFVRFSTGKKPKIEHLGSLKDDSNNGMISIHDRATSFGGDVISDDKGNLYLFSARNHVFKVKAGTNVATHVLVIGGLPENFTVNGVVVDGEGDILVSSAVDPKSYYVVNAETWSASPYKSMKEVFRSSDLANGNFLSTKKKNVVKEKEVIASSKTLEQANGKFAKLMAIYPNPVVDNRISVQFKKVPMGNYTLELRDALGRHVSQSRIVVNADNQVQVLEL